MPLETEKVGTNLWPPLHLAVLAGDTQRVQQILDDGADINEGEKAICGYTALALAVTHGQTEMVRLLLERGADVNNGNHYVTPLHLAKLYEHNDISHLLEEHGGEAIIFHPEDDD